MAAQIITPTEFKALRDLGYKVDNDKATEAIREAQQVDLYDAFGQFTYDIIINKDAVPYADLMNGSIFTISGDSFIHEGIKSLLGDYAYARYLRKLQYNADPFGITIKIGQDSQPVEKRVIDEMIIKTMQDADVKKQAIDKYIAENKTSTLFDRHRVGTGGDSGSIGSIRYKVI